MPMLPARHYESEHTRFIREMKDRKPELEREQQESRAIWWDKRPADLASTKTDGRGQGPAAGLCLSGPGLASTTRRKPMRPPRTRASRTTMRRAFAPIVPASSRWSARWRASSSTTRSSSTRASRCPGCSSSSSAASWPSLLVLAVAHATGATGRIREITRGWVAVRAIVDAVATMLFLVSLFHLPLANATAINMASPLIITLLAACFLQRAARSRRGGSRSASASLGSCSSSSRRRRASTATRWCACCRRCCFRCAIS